MIRKRYNLYVTGRSKLCLIVLMFLKILSDFGSEVSSEILIFLLALLAFYFSISFPDMLDY